MAENQHTIPEDRLKEDLLEIKYRPALLVVWVFALVFVLASLGSMVGGRQSNVLVIISSLPLSLFTLPLLDTIENPTYFALVLYGLNLLFGAGFWFLAVLVSTNISAFLAHRKLDYLLIVIIAALILVAFVFKHLRDYGFFLGKEGAVVWKEGLPHKRIYLSSENARGRMMLGGMGWIARYEKGSWVHFKVPGKSRKFPDSMVANSEGLYYAKFGMDVYEIAPAHWTRIPLKRSAGRLTLSKEGTVLLFSTDGVLELHGIAFEPVEAYGDCVPSASAVFTDSHGWQWTGGRLGHMACVFDGKMLIEIEERGVVPGAPSSDSATAFAEDKEGVLYFGTEKGAVYRVSDRVAERVPLKYPDDAGMVTSMVFDQRGELILTYENPSVMYALYKISIEKETIEQVGFPKAQTYRHLCCLVRDDDRKIWLGTNRGIVLFEETPSAAHGNSR
jgi:hypothetical protein